MKIGFIGLGNMGGAMAANLLKAGYDLTGHDSRPGVEKFIKDLGGHWAGSPREAAFNTDLIISSLPGPKQVEAVALGPAGILEGLRAGAIYADLTTSTPTLIRRISGAFQEKGVAVLDAPVSGGPTVARAAKLSFMVGGDKAAFEKCLPVFKVLGEKIVYAGAVGSGTTCKLVHNLIAYSLMFLTAEGLTLGVKAGVEPRALWNVIRQSGLGQGTFFQRVLAENYLRGHFDPPNFALNLAVKDISLALELAKEYTVPLSMSSLTLQDLLAAVNRGWGDRDSRIAMLLQEERAGVEVRVPGSEIDADLKKNP